VSRPQIALEAVRRHKGGRIHLTPRVPSKGPLTVLCGQTLDSGTYSAVSTAADCSNCLRRSHDQSRVSSAFFAQDEGGELLRLSLEQARFQRPHRSAGAPRVLKSTGAPAAPKPAPNSASTRPRLEVLPDRLGELLTREFKPAGEGVWRSPGGVIVRMRRQGREWRFAELVFEGSVVATRQGDGIRVRAGDVEVVPAGDEYEVRIKTR